MLPFRAFSAAASAQAEWALQCAAEQIEVGSTVAAGNSSTHATNRTTLGGDRCQSNHDSKKQSSDRGDRGAFGGDVAHGEPFVILKN